MMYKLFLDDTRKIIDVTFYINDPIYTKDGWIVAKNYDEFISTITEFGIPNYISLDHDLGDVHNVPEYTEKTGYDCVKWLVDYCIEHDIPFPNYKVHSMNIVGELNMITYIENYNKQR